MNPTLPTHNTAKDAIAAALAGAPHWVTHNLVEKTICVMQRYYDRPLTPDDALEIITNISLLFGALEGGPRS